MGRQFDVTYSWSDESSRVADRLDFVARAGEISRGSPAVLLIVGENDDDGGFRRPVATLCAGSGGIWTHPAGP